MLFCISVSAQQQDSGDENSSVQLNRMDRATVNLPTTFSESPAKGSPWFSPVWVPGQVNFTDGHSLPLPGEVLYLNFDKAENRLYYKRGDSIVPFQGTSIRDFQLNDSVGIHSFSHVSKLNASGFFEVLVESPSGYSLYRKRLSRLRAPDYVGVGYTSTGSKSARYVDDSLYFLIYPDAKKVSRFSISHAGLRKKLTGINAEAAKFMETHPGPVTDAMLISLLDGLNEKPATP